MNSRDLLGASFVRAAVWNLRRMLCTPLLSAALLFGLCQPGLAQYEALELGPEQPAPILPAAGVTVFQNVRIFDGKNAALSAPSSAAREGQHHRADIGEPCCHADGCRRPRDQRPTGAC